MDVAVVGAGPSGMVLAAALADAGAVVAVVDPDPDRRWPATYGVWADELAAAGLDDVAARTWARTEVVVGGRVHDLSRAYALIDNAALAAELSRRLAASSSRMVKGVVGDVAVDGPVARLDGIDLTARVVIDATGRGQLTPRPLRPRPAAQVAWGVTGTASAPLGTPGAMVLMDWRAAADDADPATPSFLYAMDLGDGRWFAEETSLAARPGVSVAVLRDRLERRLQGQGVTLTDRDEPEVVAIPMGGALPRVGDVAAWGAAAGMVHPATGYSLGAALRRAPEVAAAITAALAAPDTTPRSVAQAAATAVWPPSRRRERALHAYGLEAVLGMHQAALSAFFATFFDQPEAWWRGYLAADLGPLATARGMTHLLAGAHASVRPALLRPAVSRTGARLARNLVAR